MSTLIFDETTARNLLKTVPRMKPSGIARVYFPDGAFELEGESCPLGSALVLTPDGKVRIESADTVNAYFEPVAKRNSQPKAEAK